MRDAAIVRDAGFGSEAAPDRGGGGWGDGATGDSRSADGGQAELPKADGHENGDRPGSAVDAWGREDSASAGDLTGVGGAGGSTGGQSGMAGGLHIDAGATTDASAANFFIPGPGDLQVTELLINPGGADTGREWVEILNRSRGSLDLSMLHVADLLNDAPVEWGPRASVLAPGAYAVLIQSGDSTKNGGIDLRTGWQGGSFGTRVSLNNVSDAIEVCVGPCGVGEVIDRFAWDAALSPEYDAHALAIDGDGRRCPATQRFGSAGDFGTPGAPNPPCP